MFYGSSSARTSGSAPNSGDSHTEWLPSGMTRHGASYRIHVTCAATEAGHVQQLVTRSLKAKGADVRLATRPVQVAPVAPQAGAGEPAGVPMRLLFSVHGSAATRGAIAALISVLEDHAGVRNVRWESDPRG